MIIEPELIADYQCGCGENPLWHPTEKRLYWLDIINSRLFRYDPATGKHEQFYASDPGHTVGGFTFQRDGGLLLFRDKGTIQLMRDDKVVKTIVPEIAIERESRFNDVFADTRGRVFCGTMPSPTFNGRLYRLDTDGQLTQLLDDVKCSNGMGFTPDRKKLYYTDSGRFEIYTFDYDEDSGALSNRASFVTNAQTDGLPDGMTVDATGCVWSARWDGSMLVCFSPEGKELRRIWFPARKVSSVAFGGEDFGDMYVTTAGGEDRQANGPGAGALFRLRVPGVHGTPEYFSNIR
jgi:D-xylono/L-arabinono-1,4-lactonase